MILQTEYPSVDKPWMKYYTDIDENIGINLETKEILWDVIEKRLKMHKDIPAFEYFGRVISRNELRNMVYQWANIFANLGVKNDEIIPVYGCWTPDIAAITFALNYIGAVPYFLKLAIDSKALEEETTEARFAIVFAGMWRNVQQEFSKNKFEKVIIYDVTDSMKQPQKSMLRFVSKIKKQNQVQYNNRILSVDTVKKMYSAKSDLVKCEFVAGKRAFITSSSGTTVGGVVKGTVATNEATLAQIYMVIASGTLCDKGDTALNNLPPTAATSLNILMFLPLFRGATVIIDPRISPEDFYRQIHKYKPNFVLTTGSLWESFYNEVEKELKDGKTFDFSFVKGWMVGGEGSEPLKFKRWNEILLSHNSPNAMLSGYGCSEVFSSIAVDTLKAQSNYNSSVPVMGVGIPFSGVTIGIFDEQGNELGYERRGELWIKSVSAMQGYYNKPELTKEILIDGWIHTGDLAHISAEGFLYIWGRMNDCVVTEHENIYLFDIANRIKESEMIKDAVVLRYEECDDVTYLSVHIEWTESYGELEKKDEIKRISSVMMENLPKEVAIKGFIEYDQLPFSPTTLKKDKNKMSLKRDGFMKL